MRCWTWLIALLAAGCGKEAEDGDVPERYRYLYGVMVPVDEVPRVRAGLPFERIELEDLGTWFGGGLTITLWRDGRAFLKDESGPQSGEVEIWDYGRLCQLIESNGFDSFEPRYAWHGFDAETTVVRVWWVDEEEPLVVEDYGGQGPVELWAIQAAIEGVARRIRWKEPTVSPAGEPR